MFTLTPPAGSKCRSFILGYEVVVDRVVVHRAYSQTRTVDVTIDGRCTG